MKKFFNDDNVMIMEGIFGSAILLIELIRQLIKWFDYRKEKKLNK